MATWSPSRLHQRAPDLLARQAHRPYRIAPTDSPTPLLILRLVILAHSDDADHRFRQADRRFQAMPITLEERRSIGALGVGVEG